MSQAINFDDYWSEEENDSMSLFQREEVPISKIFETYKGFFPKSERTRTAVEVRYRRLLAKAAKVTDVLKYAPSPKMSAKKSKGPRAQTIVNEYRRVLTLLAKKKSVLALDMYADTLVPLRHRTTLRRRIARHPALKMSGQKRQSVYTVCDPDLLNASLRKTDSELAKELWKLADSKNIAMPALSNKKPLPVPAPAKAPSTDFSVLQRTAMLSVQHGLLTKEEAHKRLADALAREVAGWL